VLVFCLVISICVDMNKKILFVCTGNYYRSKFSEIYFNHCARKYNIFWSAFSRGFDISNPDNKGWIFDNALNELVKLGIVIPDETMPTIISVKDIEKADVVIALDENEHKDFVEKHFPAFSHRFTYWNVPDLYKKDSSVALNIIRDNISHLLKNLKGN